MDGYFTRQDKSYGTGLDGFYSICHTRQVVKVESRDKEEMCALARTMPKSSGLGRDSDGSIERSLLLTGENGEKREMWVTRCGKRGVKHGETPNKSLGHVMRNGGLKVAEENP